MNSRIAPVRVLIVDDHFVVRAGTHALLQGIEGIEVVGEAGDGQEALTQVGNLAPDVILIDVDMPRVDGVEATRTILARYSQVRVVILSGIVGNERTLEAIRAGALGYVSKSSTQEVLVETVRRAARGEPSLPPDVTQKLLTSWQQATPSYEALTARELDVLRLIAQGLSNQEIAERIFIAEVTVRTHVSRILGKLGLKNRVEAALYALRNGLASLEESTADKS